MRRVAGVDGVRDRWLVAVLDGSGRVTWSLLGHAATVLEATADCAAVGVDVPIGLPEHGYRRCDLDARELLGGARSSVFHAPVRATLTATSHHSASEASAAVHGKRISVQTWGLIPKIAQWDTLDLGDQVVEVHPEVSFRAMAPRLDFAGKKTARGAAQRMRALHGWRAEVLAELPRDAPLDDALDALACAWTAARWASGEAEVLGGESDATGRAMRIVV
jgi:predicted RNase H-like nuclease